MRKPIDEALKWFNNRESLKYQKDPTLAESNLKG